MESFRVFAPASVANVSCGYDIFGLALHDIGDEITIKKRTDKKLVIQEIIGADLPSEPEKNVATVAIQSLLDHIDSSQGMDLSLVKKVPPCSGLGSSASSASGAVFAANELLQTGFTKHELIPFAMQGEFLASQCFHADNISPAMLGGFTVVRSVEPTVDVFNLEYPKELHVLIVFPQVSVKTSEAKELLGDMVELKKARRQWGNVAGLVSGLLTKDWDLIQRSMEDVIAEPLRKKLIPSYDQVKELALSNGAIGFNISGSGPSMFAFFRNQNEAKNIVPRAKEIYHKQGIECICYVSEINPKGAEVL